MRGHISGREATYMAIESDKRGPNLDWSFRKSRRVTEFLKDVLANGPLSTIELEVRARSAGLLNEAQCITHSKLFKRAKKSLGIRSVRSGFSANGGWSWSLGEQSGMPISDTAKQPAAGSRPTADIDGPPAWMRGIESLSSEYPPADVPKHRWRQFLGDCKAFLAWTDRAAELGWDGLALFGCHRDRPLMYLRSAGLLWATNGGRVAALHRDWASIELPNKEHRVYHRRRLDPVTVTLPWELPQGGRDHDARAE